MRQLLVKIFIPELLANIVCAAQELIWPSPPKQTGAELRHGSRRPQYKTYLRPSGGSTGVGSQSLVAKIYVCIPAHDVELGLTSNHQSIYKMDHLMSVNRQICIQFFLFQFSKSIPIHPELRVGWALWEGYCSLQGCILFLSCSHVLLPATVQTLSGPGLGPDRSQWSTDQWSQERISKGTFPFEN